MSWIQNEKRRNPEKPVSGCLGRMMNLFDLNTSVRGNKLLTETPHHDGSSFPRRQSNVTGTNLVDDQINDKAIVSDLRKSPIKMLIAQEMSKEEDCKQSQSNLVAKLMELDSLVSSASLKSQSRSLEFLHHEHGLTDTKSKNEINEHPNKGEYKDVNEIHENNSLQKGRCSEKQKMALIREKFMEEKHLSTDDKRCRSKQFQDELKVLSSNKDMFLKFLHDPSSLFSQNLFNLPLVLPPPDARRITILKPSKLVHSETPSCNKNSSDTLFSPKSCKINDNPTQSTRIVVLKPSSLKPHNTKVVSSSASSTKSHDDVFDEDPKEIANEMCDNLSGLRRVSSVFSNGYIGDVSSYFKSEMDYEASTLSDFEVVSPASRYSWDNSNHFNSHYCASSSHTFYTAHESYVCKEAKKRLSERWAIMSSNKNVLKQREIQTLSSTLGDMLALSDLTVKSDENYEIGHMNKDEYADKGSQNLMRSKSVPARLGVEVSGFLKGKADDTKDTVKEKLVKSSSFKGRVSSLFFSKNKKSSKEKSYQPNGMPQCTRFSPKNIGKVSLPEVYVNFLLQWFLFVCSLFFKVYNSFHIYIYVGISIMKPEINHNDNQDQPSLVLVLEPQSEDNKRTNCHHNSKQLELGKEHMKRNLIDKSPPIGSISRTLSWDDSVMSPTCYLGKPSSTLLNREKEVQEYIAGCGPYSGAHSSLNDMTMSSMNLIDRVWGQMKEWMPRTEICGWEEVVGRGCMEGLRREVDNIRKEIEGKLLEELVQESRSRSGDFFTRSKEPPPRRPPSLHPLKTTSKTTVAETHVISCQYFQNRPAHVTESENAREVNPPTIHVDEASEGERYDEEDPDYDTEGSEAGNEEMFTLWIVLAILMVDVMPRGHGGDGDDDPTPPGGYRRGVHEDDVEPPRRKTRGKAKNIKLMRAVSTNKGPLEVPFDTEATFTPVGERNDWFTREIGIYMQANIAFDKKSWGNVSDHEKNALYEHLRESFDLNAVERDLEAAKKKGGIEGAIMKRYRDRKARAKQHFLSVGGEADLEKSRLDAFYNAHTYKDGTFDSPLAQDHYDRLKSAFDSRTEPNTDGEHDAGSSTHMNDVEVFEEVMDQRRGHYRGIGPKPTGAASPASVGYSGHSQRQPRFTKEDYQEMFQDPNFRDELTQFLGSMNPSNKGNDGYDDEDDDDE
ncbi:hypothetical protein E3N88_21999 [Mikania micrantha]|uniref:DUF3741 domain-containing protein n=1 Tax=Mikania micrantha TaxID=192012 RepID=A0A5N6NBR5_9ASTR|nr:hypothetical protein E3N88_21999 [Mikania micrantha]